MKIQTEFYLKQKAIWPQEGRHILAHFDDTSVLVYQAYNPNIGHFAARHGYFGGESSFNRIQWDPDHSPSGGSLQRRAIQLGLRDQVLEEYSREAVIEIEDISAFVEEQRPHAQPQNYKNLVMPVERVYLPAKPEVAGRLKLSTAH